MSACRARKRFGFQTQFVSSQVGFALSADRKRPAALILILEAFARAVIRQLGGPSRNYIARKA